MQKKSQKMKTNFDRLGKTLEG